MRQVSIALMIFGFGSMALIFLDRQFTILMWIDNWGPTVGWAIRIAMVVAGVVLFFLSRNQEAAKTPA